MLMCQISSYSSPHFLHTEHSTLVHSHRQTDTHKIQCTSHTHTHTHSSVTHRSQLTTGAHHLHLHLHLHRHLHRHLHVHLSVVTTTQTSPTSFSVQILTHTHTHTRSSQLTTRAHRYNITTRTLIITVVRRPSIARSVSPSTTTFSHTHTPFHPTKFLENNFRMLTPSWFTHHPASLPTTHTKHTRQRE
jgi:hypothetical protein